MFGINLSDFFFGPARGATNRALQRGEQYGYIQEDPRQAALTEQLLAQSRGEGPSLAQAQYEQANQDAIANQYAVSRGRGAGAARTASQQGAQIAGSLAGGSAIARLQEQQASQQLAQQALHADFQRAAANQAMYQQALQLMQQQGGIGQSLMGLAGQGLGMYASLRGPAGAVAKPALGAALGNAGQSAMQGVQQVGSGVMGALGALGGGRPDDPWAGSGSHISLTNRF